MAGLVHEHDEELDTLTGRHEALCARVTGFEELGSNIEPWIGPNGQLRVRLERLEQAFLALLEDVANNPATAAERAHAVLTSFPPPQA